MKGSLVRLEPIRALVDNFFMINFEYISHLVLVFLLLTLIR